MKEKKGEMERNEGQRHWREKKSENWWWDFDLSHKPKLHGRRAIGFKGL